MASNINVEGAFGGTFDVQSTGNLNGQTWNDLVPHSFTGTGIIHTLNDSKKHARASITLLFATVAVRVRFGLVNTPNESITVSPSDMPITFSRRSSGYPSGFDEGVYPTYLEQLYKLDNYTNPQYFPRNRKRITR